MKRNQRVFLFAGLFAASLALAAVAGEIFWTEPASPGNARAMVELPGTFAPLAEKCIPAVVTVYTKKKMVGQGFFFGPVPFVQEGAGSGFIISADGYILTNNHVVAGSDSIKVAVGVDNKKEYEASLIGVDTETDVALIKIPSSGLPVLPLGDSDSIRVGDWVAAIGSPFNFPHTFTVGVVSAKGRRLGVGNYDDFIQTDASINSGNSGGPLINLRGEVVGINTLIISPSPNGGNVGIGFANAINLIKSILPQLRDQGEVTRSWLGVSIEPVTEEMAESLGLDEPVGGHVVQVVVESPADKVGIEVDDVIVEFNGKKIQASRDLPALVSTFGVGRKADITWLHRGQRITKEVILEKLPQGKELARFKVRGGASTDNVLGLGVRDLTPEDKEALGITDAVGVLVVQVAAESSAEANDIQLEDVIYKINGVDVGSVSDFDRALKSLQPGGYVKVSIRRGNAFIFRVFRLPR